MADLASNALQENLLTLLSFDEKYAPIIRGSVEPHMFGGLYNEIVVRVYAYIDKHGKPPMDHLPDLLEDKLAKSKKREINLYEDILIGVKELSETINAEYVMSQLESFIKRQNYRLIAIDLAKELKKDTEASLEEADRLISKAQLSTLKVFDPGINLANREEALRFLQSQTQGYPTGIKELDDRGFGPTRKEMFMFVGVAKAGKSWFLTQIGKMALVHKLRVSHITLEMSEDRVAQRYFQTFFAMAKRNEKQRKTKIKRDKFKRIRDFEYEEVKPKLSLDDPDISKKLTKLISKWGRRVLKNIYIKQFPTGSLTVRKLISYLDNLGVTKKFYPDIIIIDYPELMYLDSGNLRLEIDQLFKELRGIAVERNVAMVIVSQSNKEGEKSGHVRGTNVAEAYLKVAHADCIVTYSQTEDENKYGLARLYVAGGRNDEDKFTIVITQNYAMGQFIVDSNLQIGNYWELVKGSNDDQS